MRYLIVRLYTDGTPVLNEWYPRVVSASGADDALQAMFEGETGPFRPGDDKKFVVVPLESDITDDMLASVRGDEDVQIAHVRPHRRRTCTCAGGGELAYSISWRAW